jgi:protein required for attachment to host cells
MTAWILVSDSASARLFSAEVRENDWKLEKTFEHPEGREFSREISPSSPPGRMQQGKAAGGRHTALEQHTTPKEAEAQKFAETLSHYLDDALAKRQFDTLVLVAAPHFLGLLRGAIGKQAAKHVQTTVDKDLTSIDALDVRKRLVDIVFPLTPTGLKS